MTLYPFLDNVQQAVVEVGSETVHLDVIGMKTGQESLLTVAVRVCKHALDKIQEAFSGNIFRMACEEYVCKS